jgi:hypothetical protein
MEKHTPARSMSFAALRHEFRDPEMWCLCVIAALVVFFS